MKRNNNDTTEWEKPTKQRFERVRPEGENTNNNNNSSHRPESRNAEVRKKEEERMDERER